MIISFSGIDGAGKSTQARYVKKILKDYGLSVCDIHMISWSLTNKIGKMLQKKGANIVFPLTPSESKKTFFWGEKLLRKIVLIFDIMRFRFFVMRGVRVRNQVLICDRFFYDLAVQGVYTGVIKGKFERFYNKIIPKPTISILLDLSPDTAQKREREHTLSYYQIKRELYLRNALLWEMVVVFEEGIGKTQQEIKKIIDDCVQRN